MTAERVAARLEELFVLGEPPHANRPALSHAENEAFALVAGWMTELGLTVERDPAANLIGRRRGTEPELPEVWVGSHLDTVPSGGRYDGALGVVGALEALARLRSHVLTRTIAVVAFRDEEGARFGRGCFGSRALCGRLGGGELDTADADGVRVRDALARCGGDASMPAGGWVDPPPACFLELHVEQGPVLERRGLPLGVVTAIVGMAKLEVTMTGRRGHAGTTPMSERADALAAAARLIDQLGSLARSLPDAVATVGRLEVEPGAPNVIPERVHLSVDARSPSPADLAELVEGVERLAAEAAERTACGASVALELRTEPVAMAAAMQRELGAAIERAGQPVFRLPSGAGHDAGELAAAGVPTAMLFVRSLAGGVSHAPDEHSAQADVACAVDVLAETVAALAG